MTQHTRFALQERRGRLPDGRRWLGYALLALALTVLADSRGWIAWQRQAAAQQKSQLDEEEEEAPLKPPPTGTKPKLGAEEEAPLKPPTAGTKSKLDEEEETPLKKPPAPATGGAAPKDPFAEEEEVSPGAPRSRPGLKRAEACWTTWSTATSRPAMRSKKNRCRRSRFATCCITRRAATFGNRARFNCCPSR